MRIAVVAAACVLVCAAIVTTLWSPASSVGVARSAECQEVPLGALAPAAPAWCDQLGNAIDTALRTPNGWSDTFLSGAVHARLAKSYLLYDNARPASSRALTSVYRTEQFAHNGHWMVDIAGHGAPAGIYEGSAADFFTGPNNGGALMRPDAAFQFDDGVLTVEFDASAGMVAYGDRVWPEVVITTAPAPSSRETNGWYAAGLFGGYSTIGCSFPSDRLSECRVYDADKITANLNAHSSAGASSVFGGAPTADPQRSAWHLCGAADPDASCRDHFKIELTRDSVTISVNGVRYMEHSGLPRASQLPNDLMTSPVYVYFASWAYLPDPTIARVHWGRITINADPLLMR